MLEAAATRHTAYTAEALRALNYSLPPSRAVRKTLFSPMSDETVSVNG